MLWQEDAGRVIELDNISLKRELPGINTSVLYVLLY
jgi:hypothetical protein